ncbi:hypothetical protein [Aeromonas eucrenophila]|uniref:Uncharacterized protein n=1 Tax=Aeromonas eucrenophila TaxID=649 RepID=A0ABW0YAY0_9GAMM|nr:hypothetical protein [Aeromonas eucrenophila]
MKSWIKVGLAGGLVVVAGLWGGSVRAAGSECLQPQSSSHGVEHYDGQSDGQRDGQRADSWFGMKLENQGSASECGVILAP